MNYNPEHIYIAGPMRGHDDSNFPAFFAAEVMLRELYPCAEICNPARMDCERLFLYDMLSADPTGHTAGVHLTSGAFTEADLKMALSDDLAYITQTCDMLYLLSGWEESKGAQAEHATAIALGLIIVYPPVAEEEPLGTEDFVKFVNAYVQRGEEVRVTSATGGQKGSKLASGSQMSPEVLKLVAEHFGKGAQKYSKNNFRKGYDWSLSIDALYRHFWDFLSGKEYDVCPEDGHGCQIEHPETGESTRALTENGYTCYNHTGSLHIVAVIWHAMVLTEFFLHQKEYDDRYVY